MESCKLEIRKLHVEDIPIIAPDPAIVIIAKRGSGKSYLVRELMEKFNDIPVGCVISESEKYDPFYTTFYPEVYVHFKFKRELLQDIYRRQMMILEKNQTKYIPRGKKIDPRCMITMDDCMASKKTWCNDELIKELIMNGRHLSITYILTMQYPLGVTPDMRTNFDFIFFLASDETKFKKLMYDNYGGSLLGDFKVFDEIHNKLTQNYGAMVFIKRSGNDRDLLDKVQYYRAKERDNTVTIKFGSSQFRKFSQLNYNSKWKLNGFDFDEKFKRGNKKNYAEIFRQAKKNGINVDNINY